MEMVICILLLSYCVLFTNPASAQTCTELGTVQQYVNTRLDGYQFGEITVETVHECVRECMFFAHCKSINFVRDNGSCELNNVDSTTVVDTELLSVDGYMLIDISAWPRVSTFT